MANREFRFNLNIVYADGTKETIADAETEAGIIGELIRNPPPDAVEGALTRNRSNVWLYFPLGYSQGRMLIRGYGREEIVPVYSKNEIVTIILEQYPQLEEMGLSAGGVGAGSYDGGRQRRRYNTRRNRKNRRNTRKANRR